MSTALLFPGQGSQTSVMRELVEREAPELLDLSLAEVGTDAFVRAREGTAYAQPAIVCASLAAWMGAGRPDAEVLAGHSLGELSALAVGGAIEHPDAVRLAAARGRAMQAAAAADPGAMVALLGDEAQSRALARDCEVQIANYNGPTQLVASGSLGAVENLLTVAKRRGVKAIRLAIAGAFHTEAMKVAVPRYREALERTLIRPPDSPVYSSHTARPFASDPAAIREQLAAALTGPVRWHETLDALYAQGVRSFTEVGPGKALTNTIKRSLDGVEARALEIWEPVGV